MQAILFALDEWARQHLHTAMPGLVRAYDARTLRARVQPALNAMIAMPDGSTEAQERVSIYDVPVQWPGGGGFVFHCDLNPGDQVWLMFSERGLGEFKRTLTIADPPPLVMFATRDAVAYPYRAAPIAPVEGVTGGALRAITPSGAGPVSSVVGATLQSADGAVYISVRDDRVRVRKGAQDVTVQDSGMSADITGTIEATASTSITLVVGGTTLEIVPAGMTLTTPSGTQTWGT